MNLKSRIFDKGFGIKVYKNFDKHFDELGSWTATFLNIYSQGSDFQTSSEVTKRLHHINLLFFR